MTITRKTIQEKQGKNWVTTAIVDNGSVNILLNDDLIARFLFKTPQLRVKYSAGNIVVTYGNGYRAIYD